MDENKIEEINQTGQKLMKGALILAVAGIMSKIFGAIFRIPLTNWIGAEGMSYYGLAYNVYSFFLIIATAGLPVAISRMVAARTALGDHKNAHKTYRVSLILMFFIGLISFLICFFGAEFIAESIGNKGAALSMKAISPVLLLSPVVASFRGYFQGKQAMNPTAISEITEQFFRVVTGLSLSYFFLSQSLEKASAGATFGASAGSMAAFIILIIIYFYNRKSIFEKIRNTESKEEKASSLLKEMLKIAIPITLGSAIMPLMNIIDAGIIMNRLQSTGWSLNMSKTLFGLISGFCDPLLGFSHIFTDAIAISMVPAVAATFTLKNKNELENNIKLGIKTMSIISYPCATGFIVLAYPILLLLFPQRPEECRMAANVLRVFGVSIISLSIMRTCSSALQGVAKMNIPVINLLIGAIFKIIVTYILVGIHSINIVGAAIGTLVAYTVAAILNYVALIKHTHIKVNIKDIFIKPIVPSVLMGVIVILSYKWVMMVTKHNSISTLISILIAVVVYFIFIFATKTISEEEVTNLPKGEKIICIAKKMHLLK